MIDSQEVLIVRTTVGTRRGRGLEHSESGYFY